MKKKIYMLPLAVVLVLASVVFISGFAGRTVSSAPSNALNALPASDIIITLDTQRLLSETLPTALADNPTLLAKVNDKIQKFQQETGVDMRTFDSLAVGLRFNSDRGNDFDAVVVARGHFNSNEVIDAGFAAAASKNKNEFQKTEEQYQGKTIFVLVPQKHAASTTTNTSSQVVVNSDKMDAKAAVVTAKPGASKSQSAVIVGKNEDPPAPVIVGTQGGAEQYDVKLKGSKEQMAVVALDANTIAAGDLKSVRAAVDASMGRERVDDELVRMATQNSSALVGFSGRIPQSVKEKMVAGSRGPEAKYIASIREFYGSFTTIGTEAETFIGVRTENAAQATDMSQALNALKMLGGMGMGQSGKGEDNPVAEMLKGLSITTQDNEVQIKLSLNQKAFARFVHGGF